MRGKGGRPEKTARGIHFDSEVVLPCTPKDARAGDRIGSQLRCQARLRSQSLRVSTCLRLVCMPPFCSSRP
eukprot:823165-Alexandrium_andersonii.AAC.1